MTTTDLTFEGDLSQAFHELRAALERICESAGTTPSSPQAVAQRFGIASNLAWKLSQLAQSHDPFGLAQHVPGPAGLEKAMDAFRGAGVPAADVRRFADAIGSYERMVELHAGDRARLNLLVASARPDVIAPPRRGAHRRQFFEASSAIFGVQARARLGVHVIRPAAGGPDGVDIASVSGLLDFQRLRPGVAWPLARFRTDADESDGAPVEEPLDPDGVERGVPILRAFSSDSVPQVQLVQDEFGAGCDLLPGPVGNTGTFSCVFGSVARNVRSTPGDPPDDDGELAVRVDTPVEWLVLDVLLHGSIAGTDPPSALLASGLRGLPTLPIGDRPVETLPLAETPTPLGRFPAVVDCPQVPTLPRLIEFTFDKLGWDPREFVGWRLKLHFPPIPTMAVMRIPLAGDGAHGR
jgi:hypothetical protein